MNDNTENTQGMAELVENTGLPFIVEGDGEAAQPEAPVQEGQSGGSAAG